MAIASVIKRVVVPAREGRAVAMTAGQRVRVVDVAGQQVGDVFAFALPGVTEHLSAAHTRGHVNRLFPRLGEAFVTDRRRRILRLVEDTSPGVHDMLIAACDPARYRALGIDGWHASCADNLHDALSAAGYTVPLVPQPVNVFMNIPVDPDGTLDWLAATSRAGDHVTFRAEIDSLVVVSACPQDLVGINGFEPSPLVVEVIAGDSVLSSHEGVISR
jgi:uncharacterized protein